MRRLVLVLATVGVLLTGCASSGYRSGQLLVSDSAPSGPGASAPAGALEYNARGCVSIGRDVVVVAPPGSRLIDDGIVTLPAIDGSSRDRQMQVSEGIPKDIRGVRVDRRSRFVPTGYDCASNSYFLIE